MMKCNFMFAKNSKAYSVYLLFRFVCSLAVSMSTVLSIVYHLEVVQLDAFQLVLVGTVQETSCFLFEMTTGVVADLYSRRRSVLIGMFLYGLGQQNRRYRGSRRFCWPRLSGVAVIPSSPALWRRGLPRRKRTNP